MIRSEPLISTVRFYNNDSDDKYADFDAICTLFWESSDTVWVKGMHGDINLKLIREFAEYLNANGVKTIKAFRADNRRLPFTSKRNGNMVEVDIPKALERLTR